MLGAPSWVTAGCPSIPAVCVSTSCARSIPCPVTRVLSRTFPSEPLAGSAGSLLTPIPIMFPPRLGAGRALSFLKEANRNSSLPCKSSSGGRMGLYALTPAESFLFVPHGDTRTLVIQKLGLGPGARSHGSHPGFHFFCQRFGINFLDGLLHHRKTCLHSWSVP